MGQFWAAGLVLVIAASYAFCCRKYIRSQQREFESTDLRASASRELYDRRSLVEGHCTAGIL